MKLTIGWIMTFFASITFGLDSEKYGQSMSDQSQPFDPRLTLFRKLYSDPEHCFQVVGIFRSTLFKT